MVGGKRMNWMENLLIIAGVSLDIFAAMECQGSLVAKINKKNLTVICGIVALAQLITLYLGHFLSSLFCHYRSVPDEKLLGQIISMVIFMILGIRLMVKAIRNEHVEEHLEHHLGIRRFVRMACISGIYTLLTGIAFGFELHDWQKKYLKGELDSFPNGRGNGKTFAMNLKALLGDGDTVTFDELKRRYRMSNQECIYVNNILDMNAKFRRCTTSASR
jgi:putative Mn2+ efflux pump MntP